MMARTPLRALVEGGHRLISRLTSTSPGMPSIGTHNGKFHCDEVLACFMLKSLPEFTHYDIIRTRDPSALSNCSIVVDVGGVYDHEKLRYDHHQRDFNDTMKTLNVLDFETKLSSAGLIYAHYGRRVIAELLALRDDSTEVNILYKKVYEAFVEAVDAIDNGIPQFDGIPRYHLGGTLSSRVGNLNPAWNDEDIDVEKRFHEAMKLVGAEFLDRLRYFHRSWLPARELVAECVENRFDIDKSGQILALDKGGVPWKEHFFTLEKEHNLLNAQITYIVFADTTSDDWRVQAIPLDEKATFENRLPLPETWRGYRNGELSKLTGIPNCVFTHMTGFIGGNRTRDGAVEMARRSLQIAGKYLGFYEDLAFLKEMKDIGGVQWAQKQPITFQYVKVFYQAIWWKAEIAIKGVFFFFVKTIRLLGAAIIVAYFALSETRVESAREVNLPVAPFEERHVCHLTSVR